MPIAEERTLMRIFIGENDRYGHQPLYEALVEMFRQEGLMGATVLKGVAGYGRNRVYHTGKLLELAHNLPLVVEVVDTQERLEAVMPKIDAMMQGGLITLEKATVISYGSS
jgi:PII-like signaling protein